MIEFYLGILRETASKVAMITLEEKIDDLTRIEYLKAGLQRCLSFGITAVQTNDPYSWELYKTIVDKNELPIRVFLSIDYTEISENSPPLPGETYGYLLSRNR